jgi:hypothetical protein
MLVARITYHLEPTARGRIAREVGQTIKAGMTVFTQTELVFATLRVVLFFWRKILLAFHGWSSLCYHLGKGVKNISIFIAKS